jgi:hypothetical protein
MQKAQSPDKPYSKYLPIILIVGLLHGLVYVFFVPPWGHYDEPGHFEYAWMIADRGSIPHQGEYDAGIRRQILQSMIRNGFFAKGLTTPDLETTSDPVPIGVSQVGDPPVYYIFAAIPLRLAKGQSVEFQLYSVRLFTLLFLLATIYVSWKFAIEISPDDSPTRWLLPLSVALLPAFVDLMSAMNSDSTAIFLYSLILLFGVRIIKYGIRLSNLLPAILCVLLAFFTKTSIWVSIIAILGAVTIALFRGRWAYIACCTLILITIGVFLAVFQFSDAALWFRDTHQSEPTRIELPSGNLDGYAFQIVKGSAEEHPALFQTLLPSDVAQILEKKVTIGAWIWADHQMSINPPEIMYIDNKQQQTWLHTNPVMVGSQPTFFSYDVSIPNNLNRIYISFDPFAEASSTGKIFIAKPVLVTGNYGLQDIPEYLDKNARFGNWSGEPFTNIIRNAGAISVWPKFSDLAYHLSGGVDARLNQGIGWVIYTLDFRGTFWYTKSTIETLFRSFWAKFGWGQIALPGTKPYRGILICTILASIGVVIGGIRKFSWQRFRIFIWFGLNIFLSLGYSWFTGISMGSFLGKSYIAVARYIYPNVLTIMAILAFGWITLVKLLPAKSQRIAYGIIVSLFVLLDFISIYSILHYYYSI